MTLKRLSSPLRAGAPDALSARLALHRRLLRAPAVLQATTYCVRGGCRDESASSSSTAKREAD